MIEYLLSILGPEPLFVAMDGLFTIFFFYLRDPSLQILVNAED